MKTKKAKEISTEVIVNVLITQKKVNRDMVFFVYS